jgi:photosystem II stability/assembly factor-like uncharacterized protein
MSIRVATIPACIVMLMVLAIGAASHSLPARAEPMTSAHPTRSAHASSAVATLPPLFWHQPRSDAAYGVYSISSVAFNAATPGTALAFISYGGHYLLRTTDHGHSWQELTTLQLNMHIPASVVSGHAATTFYVINGSKIFKTENSGTSWTQVQNSWNCTFSRLAIHPVTPTIFYARTSYGFARSLDGGQSWEAQDAEFCGGGPRPTSFAVGVNQPSVVYVSEYEDDGGGVTRSTDYGASWQEVSTGLPHKLNSTNYVTVLQVIVDPRNADVAYALLENGNVFKTTSGGAQWELLNQGVESVLLRALAYDQAHDYRLYASTYDSIYMLEDGATTWQRVPTTPLAQPSSSPNTWYLTVDPADETRLIAYGSQGMHATLPQRGKQVLPMVEKGY